MPQIRTLPSLPIELFEEIISLALDCHPARHAIPRVNSTWAERSLPLLHSRISLTSRLQLHQFSSAQNVLCCASGGREVEVQLPGGTEGMGIWAMIYQVLARCQRHAVSPGKSCCRGVRVLKLCLNSHMSYPNDQMIHEALSQVNPEVFVWTGPDPDHHFSTAIIPNATIQLCKAIYNWSSLKRLELSNIAFVRDGRELAEALTRACECLPFPFDPPHTDGVGPREIVVRQAVFMLPVSALRIALGLPALRELRLVDVYQHSIWGPRMRIGDVEALLTSGKYLTRVSERECVERVREMVRCVAKTERLLGGDREVQDA